MIILSYTSKNYKTETCLDYPLYQSKKGNYFIGQTTILSSQNQHALVALSNPSNSNVNIYLNAITITNFATTSLSAQIYLNSNFSQCIISNLFSSANTSIIPQPIPEGEIQYLDTNAQPPTSGVNIFDRIVSPSSTLVIDGSQIIIGPGQSILLYLGGYLPISIDSTIVAFGWWEEEICNKCCN